MRTLPSLAPYPSHQSSTPGGRFRDRARLVHPSIPQNYCSIVMRRTCSRDVTIIDASVYWHLSYMPVEAEDERAQECAAYTRPEPFDVFFFGCTRGVMLRAPVFTHKQVRDTP